MSVESASYIPDLDASKPVSTDGIMEGDDHIRLIKTAIKATLPNLTGAMTVTHTVLNGLPALIDGLTAGAAQAVLKDGSIAMSGDLNLGTHKVSGVVDPVLAQDAATKNYVDTTAIYKAGDAVVAPTTADVIHFSDASDGGNSKQASLAAVLSLLNPLHTMTVLDKSATYALDASADRGAFVYFTTAGVTFSLPAAAGNNGLWCIVNNAAASGDITIDPNAAETLDLLASRKLRPGDTVLLLCNGSAWATVFGTYSFTSTAQVLALDNAYVLAHGLGEIPNEWECWLVNKETELGYVPGDRIRLDMSTLGSTYGGSLSVDATNLNIGTQQSFGVTPGRHKTTNVMGSYATPAKWDLFGRCRVRKG